MRRLSSALLRGNPDPPPLPRPARRRIDLLLDVPRCPCCHGPLVARQGRTGPAFYCLCRTKQFGKDEQ